MSGSELRRDAAAPSAHQRGGFDCAPCRRLRTADRQQLGEELSHLRKGCERGKPGGHIGKLGGQAAVERQRRKSSSLTMKMVTSAPDESPNSERHVAE